MALPDFANCVTVPVWHLFNSRTQHFQRETQKGSASPYWVDAEPGDEMLGTSYWSEEAASWARARAGASEVEAVEMLAYVPKD